MTNGETEKRSWDVANKLRANSKLSAAEYSTPVLGLIFLRHADAKFTKKEKEFSEKSSGSRRKIQKISTTPSNYDDLIENNTKRIAILEKTAKLIYDEWFVKFKFPEHENVRMVDSELGKIPEGWEVKKLGDVCDFTMGQSPKSKFYNEMEMAYHFIKALQILGVVFQLINYIVQLIKESQIKTTFCLVSGHL